MHIELADHGLYPDPVAALRRHQIALSDYMIEVVRANALLFDALGSRDRARADAVAARLRLRLARGLML